MVLFLMPVVQSSDSLLQIEIVVIVQFLASLILGGMAISSRTPLSSCPLTLIVVFGADLL